MTVYRELPAETRNTCTFCIITHLNSDEGHREKREGVLKYFRKKEAFGPKAGLLLDEFYKECNVDAKYVYEKLIGRKGILDFRKTKKGYIFWLKEKFHGL